MSFLAPLGFLGLLLLPVIIAMYLLKLRREDQVVSSVYVWQRMVRELEANAPWQRLRRNLLLLLQLLFLLLIVIALARPFTWVEGSAGKVAIIILDTSASMGATDAVPNRLAAAKMQARQLVDNLADDARVTIIAAGGRASVLIPSSQDRRQVFAAIDSLQVEASSSDLAAALQLASAVAARQPDAEILLLSDGRSTLPERLTLQAPLRYFPIGTGDNNQAIGLFTLEAAPGGEDLSAFIQVSNYASTAVTRRLDVFADGVLINAFELELPVQGVQAVFATGLPTSVTVVEARLAGSDDLAVDDRAWAVYHPPSDIDVQLVSTGNLFLETALSLLPGVNVTRLTPESFFQSLDTFETRAAPNLRILDSIQLTNTLDISHLPGNLFIIGPLASTSYYSVTGQVLNPTLSSVTTDDARLRNVQLESVSVLDAAFIPLPEWSHTLVQGTGQRGDETVLAPILFAGQVDNRQVAVLTFQLQRSDLPLQVAFPLLLANLINWFAPEGGVGLPGQITPGTSIQIPVRLGGGASVNVFLPNGERVRMEGDAERLAFTDTTAPGVYRIRWEDGTERHFAVNMLASQESDIRPAGVLNLVSNEPSSKQSDSQQGQREWWRPLALLALAALVLEWFVYHRGTLVGLYRKWSVTRASRSLG